MELNTQHTNITFAILPLQILSDDPSIETFCTGLVMDLITDLSRFRSFRIISYDAVRQLQPHGDDDHDIFDRLHPDYIVKGAVRHQNNKLIFNIQLVNTPENRLVWAEKFSGPTEEIFHIQEEITEKIVVSLQHFVDHDLLAEIRRKPLTNLNAYECWIRGYQEIKKGTIEADEKARAYFQQAMTIDPHYARAYTGMSLSYFNEWSCQLWNRWEISHKGAFEWAQKAVELDDMDHVSTAILGRIYLFNGEYDKAEHFLRKALRLNPNDAENLVLIAFGLVYLGYPKEARRLYENAWRLNPASDDAYFSCGAFVNFELGNFDEAIRLGEKHQLEKGWVDFPAYLAAAHYHKGNYQRMAELWQFFLKVFEEKINRGKPADTPTALKWMMEVNPYRGETHLKPFWEYISKEGLKLNQYEKPADTDAGSGQFTKDSGVWSISYNSKKINMPDLKGFHDIARLLNSPNHSLHCTELMDVQVIESGADVFDQKAKNEYQQKILELQRELEEAENSQNMERVAELQEEYDQLIDHLSKATGLGGRTRKSTGSIEKARTAVTWRIRNAIKKISEVHPELGKHLEVSIKTGVFCKYSPESEIKWSV